LKYTVYQEKTLTLICSLDCFVSCWWSDNVTKDSLVAGICNRKCKRNS